jgi:hypothetical protein
MKLHIMYFSPVPCYPIPFRLKYSLQHPILKHAAYIPPSVWATEYLTHTEWQAKS